MASLFLVLMPVVKVRRMPVRMLELLMDVEVRVLRNCRIAFMMVVMQVIMPMPVLMLKPLVQVPVRMVLRYGKVCAEDHDCESYEERDGQRHSEKDERQPDPDEGGDCIISAGASSSKVPLRRDVKEDAQAVRKEAQDHRTEVI